MIAVGEDPFAIQLLVQSADKMLIDLAKKRGLKPVFNWEEFLKPEYQKAMFNSIRETSHKLMSAKCQKWTCAAQEPCRLGARS